MWGTGEGEGGQGDPVCVRGERRVEGREMRRRRSKRAARFHVGGARRRQGGFVCVGGGGTQPRRPHTPQVFPSTLFTLKFIPEGRPPPLHRPQ